MIDYSTFLANFEDGTTLFYMVALLTFVKEITLAMVRDDLCFWQADKTIRIAS